MKKKYSNRNIMILIVIAIIFIGCLVLKIMFVKSNDISEIKPFVNEFNLEYQSERGFGNDRFDIYSFSLKDNSQNIGFKTYYEAIEEIYINHFKSIMNTEADSDNAIEKISSDIEKIKKEKEISYMNVKSNGTQKIYLYCKKLNKGYCLILTI